MKNALLSSSVLLLCLAITGIEALQSQFKPSRCFLQRQSSSSSSSWNEQGGGSSAATISLPRSNTPKYLARNQYSDDSFNAASQRKHKSASIKKTGSTGPRKQKRNLTCYSSSYSSSRQKDVKRVLGDLSRPKEIDAWMKDLVAAKEQNYKSASEQQVGDNNDVFPAAWTSRHETDFIRILRDFGAYEALELFVRHFARKNVYVYTAAISALANAKIYHTRQRAVPLLDQMDQTGVLPSSFTYAALFQSIDGPDEAKKVMSRLQKYKSRADWSVEAFNQAIVACSRRASRRDPSTNRSWQVALDFFYLLRREGLAPNLTTYTALLRVCAQMGQLKIALSLLQELESTPGLEPDSKLWGALLNVCAQAGGYKQANTILKRMQKSGFRVDLFHCSAFLKALSRAGEVSLSLHVLDMMLGTRNTNNSLELHGSFQLAKVPIVAPDLVALNTVLTCCAKAGDFNAARNLLDRMKNAEFQASGTSQPILPDEISYSLLLSACCDPNVAKDILREIKLTRRHRVGVINPSSITYARAIAVCRKAEKPNVDDARFFLAAAREDGVEATVFMYSAAIWTAERSGDCKSALNFLEESKSLGIVPNNICYDGVMAALAPCGRIEEALTMYEEMRKSGLRPTGSTFKALASAVRNSQLDSTTHILQGIFDSMDEKDQSVGGPLIEALIKAYGQAGSYPDAKRVFDMIEGPANSQCLRAVLYACATAKPNSRWDEAISILHTCDITVGARGPGGVDQGALSNALIACSKAERWEEGWNLLQLYGVSASASKAASSLSVVALNALIAACGRKGRPDVAVHILNTMESKYGVTPDKRSYRSAIIACNQAEHEKRRHQTPTTRYGRDSNRQDDRSLQWWECSLSLLRRMRESGLQPDIQTFSSCISCCEAAGQWQRALGVLQTMIDESSQGQEEDVLNLFCFNAAVSACEKGGAWLEALEIYERMISYGGLLTPNFVTLSSLVLALVKGGQKELAQSKYEEGVAMKIVNPWRITTNAFGAEVRAMDLHQYNHAMASTAVRNQLDLLLENGPESSVMENGSLIVIVGKGLRSVEYPVLRSTVMDLFQEYGISATADPKNSGRLVVAAEALSAFVSGRTWR